MRFVYFESNMYYMNVIFKLDKPKNKTSLVMMVYRFGGKKLVISTTVSIPKDKWNLESQRVKEEKGHPEYLTFNKLIDKYKLALLKALDTFVSKNETPTVLQLKESIFAAVNPDKNKSTKYSSNVCKFIQQLIDSIDDMNNDTRKVYSQILKNFKKFPKGTQLDFKDLSSEKLNAFSNFYINTPRESGEYYRRGTIYRHLKHFITIINKAKDHDIPVNNDYSKSSWRIDPPNDAISGNDVVLSEHEIEILESAELSERFDKIRDIFLLGLYTGQRYSDYAFLSIDNIININGKEYLEILQKKKIKGKEKNKLVRIPYSNKIKAIFDKYCGYPKAISLQKFNESIKELSKILGFDDPIIIYEDIPSINKVVKNIYPKWQFISTHTARRTFCTNGVLRGIPEKIIMQVSGHTTIKTFRSYVRINTETKANDDLLFQYFG